MRGGSRAWRAMSARAWDRVRRLALARDDYRCRACGHPGDLEVHHVEALAAGGAPLALANVRTLCRSCHMGEHGIDGERLAWRRWLAGLGR